jgi:peptidyl-dipeptidase A
VPRPEGRTEPDWVHVALAPVYYHNYLLGDLMVLQLTRGSRASTSFCSSGARWSALRSRLFRDGAPAVERGAPPRHWRVVDPAHYVEQFVRERA